MSWTQEREEKLKELWKKGHTASQIAEILGGTTRNAVIGKAHRLKLAARAAPKGSKTIRKQASVGDKVKNEKFDFGKTFNCGSAKVKIKKPDWLQIT